MTIEIADGRLVWLGGKEIEGKWQWSNGENMTENGFYEVSGQEPYCMAMQYGSLQKRNCEKRLYAFICTLPLTSTVDEKTTFIVQSYDRFQ